MVYNQIVVLNFAGSNDSMEIYPAILMHIQVEIWGNPYEIKNIDSLFHYTVWKRQLRKYRLKNTCCKNTVWENTVAKIHFVKKQINYKIFKILG